MGYGVVNKRGTKINGEKHCSELLGAGQRSKVMNSISLAVEYRVY